MTLQVVPLTQELAGRIALLFRLRKPVSHVKGDHIVRCP